MTPPRLHPWAELYNMAALVARITQLDAKELDQELHSLFREQLRRVFKYFRTSFLTKWEPEMDALLKLAVFSFSVRAKRATVGQQLLNIKYVDCVHLQSPSSRKMWLLMLAIIGGDWLQARIDSLSILLQNSPELQSFQKLLAPAEMLAKFVSLFHLMVFLVEGKYLTLTERLVGLRPVPNDIHQMRQVGYEYVNREILWHGFAEFLSFIVPLVNTRRMWSMLKNKFGKENVASTTTREPSDLETCSLCEESVTLPHQVGCAHVFCYYCVMSEFLESEKFSCPSCRFVATSADSIIPVTWRRLISVSQ